MCRLLYIRSLEEFSIEEHLQKFASICKNSTEYQGHGWGCSYLMDDEWRHYKNINPIWEDNLDQFSHTNLLVAHVRSAFQDKDIVIENNMPFIKNDIIYIFNGELHGVKIKEHGRIGAEKIFNFILRFYKGSIKEAMQKGTKIVESRSRYIRAMNIIMADKSQACVSALFNEDEDYFTMYTKKLGNGIIICSEPYPKEKDWQPIKNRTIEEF
jgi:predicted glutamine amidotransferase